MKPAHADDRPAVEASAAGDDELLADLYARWSPLVYSLALDALGDVARAEAVTQQVFSRAWSAREASGSGPTRFRDQLVALTRREVAGTRAAQGPPRPTGSEESGGSESSTGVRAERLLVADGVAHLDTPSWRVLQLALDHGLTAGEIAGRTGLRVEEVRSRLATGLIALRNRLKGDADAH